MSTCKKCGRPKIKVCLHCLDKKRDEKKGESYEQKAGESVRDEGVQERG